MMAANNHTWRSSHNGCAHGWFKINTKWEVKFSSVGPYKAHLIQMGQQKHSIQQNFCLRDRAIPTKCFDSAGKIQLISQGKWTVLKSVVEDNISGRQLLL